MEVYQQHTCFAAANTPLFTHLFGPTLSAAAETARRTQRPQQTLIVSRSSPVGPSTAAAAATLPTDEPPLPHLAAQEDQQSPLSSSAMCNEGILREESTSTSHLTDEKTPQAKLKKPALPFRAAMRDMEQRFQEQMEVHRGLNAALRELNVLHSEVSLHRTERRTAVLAAALHRCPRHWPSGAQEQPADSAVAEALAAYRREPQSQSQFLSQSQSQPQSQPQPQSQFLSQILSEFQSQPQSQSKPQPQRRGPIDIVRPPEEPQPYVRVIYVPLETAENEDKNAKKEKEKEEREEKERSYSDDFNSGSSDGVSTVMSTTSPSLPLQQSSVLSSVESIATSIPSPASSSLQTESVATDTSILSRSSRRSAAEQCGTHRDDGLIATLCELRRACRGANQLMHRLEQRDSPQNQSETQSLHHSKDSVSSAGGEDWAVAIRRDMRDVRKLRRFVARLKTNIQAIDCQQRARETRRALLVKAQRLARARRRMQRDGSTLADIMDEVEDLFGNNASDNNNNNGGGAGGSNSWIDDEVATAMGSAAASWDSVSDELIMGDDDDDYDMNNKRGYNDSIDDEVMDEVNGSRGAAERGGGDDNDEILDEMLDEIEDWAPVESDFADALADATDVDDLAVPLLPSDASSVKTALESPHNRSGSVVDETMVRPSKGVAGTTVETTLSYEHESIASDADVSSVMPPTSCTEHDRDTHTDQENEEKEEEEKEENVCAARERHAVTLGFTPRGTMAAARTESEEESHAAGEWREQQAKLIRKLRPKGLAPEPPGPLTNHWAALEGMLECRFGPTAEDCCAARESRIDVSDEEKEEEESEEEAEEEENEEEEEEEEYYYSDEDDDATMETLEEDVGPY